MREEETCLQTRLEPSGSQQHVVYQVRPFSCMKLRAWPLVGWLSRGEWSEIHLQWEEIFFSHNSNAERAQTLQLCSTGLFLIDKVRWEMHCGLKLISVIYLDPLTCEEYQS